MAQSTISFKFSTPCPSVDYVFMFLLFRSYDRLNIELKEQQKKKTRENGYKIKYYGRVAVMCRFWICCLPCVVSKITFAILPKSTADFPP